MKDMRADIVKKKNYKENVTKMTEHNKNECKEVPLCISKSLLSPNKSKFNHSKFI